MIMAENIAPPAEFPFPFPPYDIQKDFMTTLFTTLNEGKLGIFESPTGTGKSLSLICGALTWFLQYQKERRRRLEALVQEKPKDTDEEDWLAAAAKQMEHSQARLEAKQELERVARREERLARIRNRRAQVRIDQVERNRDEFEELFKEVKWIKKAVDREIAQGDSDDNILLEEYHSDGEAEGDEGEDGEEEEEDSTIKIFYCSRTHSQLTQFVREVKKSPFGGDVSLVSLASRGVMCINPAVRSLGSQGAINQRCLELGRSKANRPTCLDEDAKPTKKAKISGGCPFNNQGRIEVLRDEAILAIHDIEELVQAGKQANTCPYYASRSAVPLCEIVVLPYNTLLHAATRQAIGLRLKNSIVIVDEAHNLLETITNIHSVAVTGGQLCLAHSQLTQYKDKYGARLKAKNLLYIKQILFIISSFIKLFGAIPGQDPNQPTSATREETKLQSVADFLSDTGIYNQNLLKLVKYCNISKICNKLHGFVEKYQPPSSLPAAQDRTRTSGVTAFLETVNQKKEKVTSSDASATVPVADTKENREGPGGSPLQSVVELLNTLATNFNESRIVIKSSPKMKGSSIRFLLLDPSSQFKEIVRDARSVVVAGGTMNPVEEFKQQLFIAAGAAESRIRHFACDHVVPAANLLPLVIAAGPSGQQLDFSYQHRSTSATLDELGRCLVNLVTVIPAGMVVFFPSYDYEELVYRHLEKSGQLSRIGAKKTIFREPRGSGDSDKVLHDYSKTVRLRQVGGNSSGGALLLAVVGGKMSEGINFSDSLGRAVVMVGMPYPNRNSPELQEKMAYLTATLGSQAGQSHYENLCMKAVNQSVGRAIRHKEDYAAIIFLDHRYGRPGVINQLPGWIRRHVRVQDKFGPTVPFIRNFFREKSEA